MTTTARLVLKDARFAIEQHSDDLQGERFRISWLAIHALLRAVGHVLINVDAQDPISHEAIKKIHEERKNAPIFKEFIVKGRNDFLKDYALSAKRNLRTMVTIPKNGKTFYVDIDVGSVQGAGKASLSVQPTANVGGVIVPIQSSIESTIKKGTFAGQHEKAVAIQACEWWSDYLDAVDEHERISRANQLNRK